MKKLYTGLLAVTVILAVGLIGCSQRASNAQDAIAQSKEKQSVEAQIDYLVGQANAFVNSKEFDEAIAVSKHILANLDQESEKAKSIIETAKAKMQELAAQKLDDAKADANKAVGDMKDKIGSFGQ